MKYLLIFDLLEEKFISFTDQYSRVLAPFFLLYNNKKCTIIKEYKNTFLTTRFIPAWGGGSM
jgi:hypothetical protein